MRSVTAWPRSSPALFLTLSERCIDDNTVLVGRVLERDGAGGPAPRYHWPRRICGELLKQETLRRPLSKEVNGRTSVLLLALPEALQRSRLRHRPDDMLLGDVPLSAVDAL